MQWLTTPLEAMIATSGTNTQLAGCEVRFLNYNFDTHIKLPTGYFFGLSATADDLSDNHDIFSFKFYDLESNVTI
uniref:L-type lectin-like domain-containing protein n=1 Tax=Glossina palpalis gambiensis TaxID=67801 RepID=A0A1B0BZI1_9MUSC